MTSYDELMVLHPALADNELSSKVSRTSLPATRSCPSTLVDWNLLPSRSDAVTVDPDDEESSEALLSESPPHAVTRSPTASTARMPRVPTVRATTMRPPEGPGRDDPTKQGTG